ncbi:MAG: DUF1761 domain-containing protein [bacterium]
MEVVRVLVAAAGSWLFGAVWYMVLAKPWMAAARVAVGPDGRPKNAASPLPYILSAVCMLLVAGMMRHVFSMAAMTTVVEGLMGGAGIGLFFISPWIMINNAYAGRPFTLTLIDGGYATIGCTIIGVLLMLV